MQIFVPKKKSKVMLIGTGEVYFFFYSTYQFLKLLSFSVNVMPYNVYILCLYVKKKIK